MPLVTQRREKKRTQQIAQHFIGLPFHTSQTSRRLFAELCKLRGNCLTAVESRPHASCRKRAVGPRAPMWAKRYRLNSDSFHPQLHPSFRNYVSSRHSRLYTRPRLFHFCQGKQRLEFSSRRFNLVVHDLWRQAEEEKQGGPWTVRGEWGSSLLMTQTSAFPIGLWFSNVLFYFLVLIRSTLENVMHYEILTSLPQPVLSFRLRIKCSKP